MQQWKAWIFGSVLGLAIGAVAIYLLRVYFDIGLTGAMVCLLLSMTLGDLLLVWDNHRAEKAGRVGFWNRPTADFAVAATGFTASGDTPYRGKVRFDGELWSAVSRSSLRRGQRVRVTGRRGLCLYVEAANEHGVGSPVDGETHGRH